MVSRRKSTGYCKRYRADDSIGTDRPKSKLRDIEFSINRLGQVLYNLSKGHYTYKKIFRLNSANNDITEATVKFI